jgi:hypothetical protein
MDGNGAKIFVILLAGIVAIATAVPGGKKPALGRNSAWPAADR